MLALSEVIDLYKTAQMADLLAEAALTGYSCATAHSSSTFDELANKVEALSNKLLMEQKSSNFQFRNLQQARSRGFKKETNTALNKGNKSDICYFRLKLVV